MTGLKLSVAAPTDERDKRIQHAIAVSLETRNHSDVWYTAAARHRRDEILQNASAIREHEANRRLRGRKLEDEYRELACRANWWFGHNESEIVKLLRKADQMPYRLLEEAMNMAQETEGNKEQGAAQRREDR